MLVRDLGDRFQIVLQPDHGELSGQIAAAWDDLPLSSDLQSALVLAAARHDDGWSVWERHPRLNDDRSPQSFLEAPRESLLSSYRACVDVLSLDSPGAALLVSMHVSGLNRNRYGVMDSPDVTPLDELAPAVREFVTHEERRQTHLASELGFDEDERWRAYRQLQIYDVMSLYLGMRDLEGEESWNIGSLVFKPRGDWAVACDPFPFVQDPTSVTMRRRLIVKRDWADDASFAADLDAAPPENVAVRLVRA